MRRRSRHRHVLLEPPGQLGVPRQRRLLQRPDLLDQARRQEPSAAAVVVGQPGGQGPAVVLVQVHRARRPRVGQRLTEHVAQPAPAQRGQPAQPPQIGRDRVVHRLDREPGEVLVVEHAVGHVPDGHLDQPAVDHEVGRDVPQVRVAPAHPVAVAQRGVQHLVGQHEPPLGLAEVGERVDVDLGGRGAHRGDRDVPAAGEVGVGHDGELRGQPAEQRVRRDEPADAPGPTPRAGRPGRSSMPGHRRRRRWRRSRPGRCRRRSRPASRGAATRSAGRP